jgi:protein-S-isoprenylcysteine O-methyltransferase Ste14
MSKEKLAPLAYVSAALLVLVASYWLEPRFPLPREIAKPVGLLIFALSMILFTWALAHLRSAFLGNVDPVTNQLVTNGPYRWIRHPTYLATVIALLGLTLALRSPWGIAVTLVLFLPAAIYRARLEEHALERRFGLTWDDYAARTSFLFPKLW